MSIHIDVIAYLDSLSTLARRGFNSNRAATEAILQLLTEQLAMRSSFLTHVSSKSGQFKVIAAHNEIGGCDIEIGMILPLYPNFQSSTLNPDGQSPLLLENLQSNRDLFSHLESATLARIGSYIGVPVILSDGAFFGTLGAVDPEPRRFSLVQAKLLVVLARLLATQIERDEQLAERKWAETELARALAALQTADEQREHMNRLQSDFVAIVNHEFRTTLTGIQGFSELMRDEEFSFQEVKEYAADINADARRLTRMINQLLDLDQMKSGQTTLHLEEVELNAILMEVIEQMRRVTSRHRFNVQFDNTIPPFLADRRKLTQVVTNLVENAVKYSSGDELFLRSMLEDEIAHVTVRDQGMGIPPEFLEQVFDPYYSRIDLETTRYVKGSGLGLPIARQIVQMHGGKAWAESILGEGSIFHFTIPLAGILTTAEENHG